MSSKTAEVERLLEKLKRTGRLEEADFEDEPKELEPPTNKFSENSSESNYDTAISDLELDNVADLPEKFEKLEFEGEDAEEVYNVDDILRPVNSEEGSGYDSGNEAEEENSDEDDDEGWITPGNTYKKFN